MTPPVRPQLFEALDVAERFAPPCPTCRGSGAQQERQTCMTCDGRGVDLATSARARECWEAMAARGLIPMAWVDDPARRFVGTERRESTCVGAPWTPLDAPGAFDPPLPDDVRARLRSESAGAVLRSTRPEDHLQPIRAGLRAAYDTEAEIAHPPTLAACVVFASDVEGIVQAETLLREIMGRAPKPRDLARFVWRLAPAAELAVARKVIIADVADVHAALNALGYALAGSADGTLHLLAPELAR